MLLYWILLPIVWVLAHILFRFEVIGRENLKAVRDGRAYVIAPNHIANLDPVSYTHLRAHETDSYLVCRLLLEKKNKKKNHVI